MILAGTKDDGRIPPGSQDDRLIGLQDVMPTLLELAGIDVPETCDGLPMTGTSGRNHLYGECNEGAMASRMIHDGRYKLIYYPAGNHRQLFDLEKDPRELHDLSNSSGHQPTVERLASLLANELYGSDRDWLNDGGDLVGLPDEECPPAGNRGLALQRGVHWPPAPVTPPAIGETNPGTN